MRILKDTRFVAEMTLLDPKPVAEAATLTQALAHVALHNPNGTAAESDGEAVTFAELFERAFALRCKLSHRPGSVVPIMAESGIAARIAVLAVLLNDGTSLMIEPAMPAEEIAKSVEHLQATDVLVTARQLATLAKVKSHLTGNGASALRALTLTSKAPVSAPPCLIPSVNGESSAHMICAGIHGKAQQTTLTQKQLLSMFDESTISSALDRLVVATDASLTKSAQNTALQLTIQAH